MSGGTEGEEKRGADGETKEGVGGRGVGGTEGQQDKETPATTGEIKARMGV